MMENLGCHAFYHVWSDFCKNTNFANFFNIMLKKCEISKKLTLLRTFL